MQGIYEIDNVHILQTLVEPGSYFFDVGTNIGLMCVPILTTVRDVRVLSFEPSPNTLPYLKRTVETYQGKSKKDVWEVVPKAVGSEIGQVTFSLSKPEDGPYDGIKNTRRVGESKQFLVDITTLDHEWTERQKPRVSMIKVDVEGAELSVLQGAVSLLEACRPFILTEWNKTNLTAYDIVPSSLYEFAHTHNYSVFAVPFFPVSSAKQMDLLSARTESFLLQPAEISGFQLWDRLIR